MLLDLALQRLEIPADLHQQAQERSQTHAVAGLRLQVYWNLVCQELLTPWLEDCLAGTPIAVHSHPPHPRQWELLNGCTWQLQGEERQPVTLVCLPDETMDRSEFRVPREWVDVPRLVGDYYLAVEVNPEQGWLEVWGYATHAQIKTDGKYDPCDRTYCLSSSYLIPDTNCLWVMLQLGSERTRRAIPPLPSLSAERTDVLIRQLSQAEIVLPRQQLSFAEWGALLQRSPVLEEICHHRQLPGDRTPEVTHLDRWLENVFEAGWQSLEVLLGRTPEWAMGWRRESAEHLCRRVKAIDFADPYPPLWLFVLLEPETDGQLGIRMRLLPKSVDACLPASLRLTLRSAEGDEVQTVQARQQDKSIQFKRFRCPRGIAFTVEIAIAEIKRSEKFVT
ncbi:DUF1822 family protein [Geitlerinema sp. PCC 9228]|uniref:DUF1822 family protein n=1 Tax=Geitlerinema sp. PCC 9228 TaxID=111611 RepID=UPI0008F9B3EC|nr:DUF1822 family protein [Geitlerinema sp. PCC 9228]